MDFHFAVLDVGQGLSQVGMCEQEAIVWDVGPRGGFAGWQEGYRLLGEPHIAALVVSHTDEDHWGGLASLDTALSFSGLVVVSIYEDTALLRLCGGKWAPRLRFRTVVAGDTLGLGPRVRIECLWPPPNMTVSRPVLPEQRNALSLVYRVRFDATSVLITADIDSFAQQKLVGAYGRGLCSDIMVVPHHGSVSAVHRSFYGHVMPSWAVVSCAAENDYGHPSDALIDLLFELGISYVATPGAGHVWMRSNGEYWTRVREKKTLSTALLVGAR